VSAPPATTGDRSDAAGDGALAAATQAFQAGDFHRVRREVERLRLGPSEPLRSEAQALLERLAPDPVIVWLTIGTAALLGLTVAMTVG
jgi:hypothetical protein